MDLLTAVRAFEAWAIRQDAREEGWADASPCWPDVHAAMRDLARQNEPVDTETLAAVFKVLQWDEEGEITKEILLESHVLARQVVLNATHQEPEEVRYQIIDLAVRLGERAAVETYLTDYSLRIRGRAERYINLGQDV